MVRIDYVDGDTEVVETLGGTSYEWEGLKVERDYFHYDNNTQCFIVHDKIDERDCMTIPREFVKSIRHIEP